MYVSYSIHDYNTGVYRSVISYDVIYIYIDMFVYVWYKLMYQ